MDVSDVRRELRAAIDKARSDAAGRRERSDAAAREYDDLLASRVAPLFHQVAGALVAEGHRFKVFTPAGSVRLASERSPDDFIELVLDTSEDPPAVIGRTSISRGRRSSATERPVRPGVAIADLSESDILGFVLAELAPFVER